MTVTEAGTVVVISTLADEAVGVTIALWMHETEQPAPAEITGPSAAAEPATASAATMEAARILTVRFMWVSFGQRRLVSPF